MKILLLEDELPALERLEKLLLAHCPEHTVVGKLNSLQAAKSWLSSSAKADLILADIQLGDGLSLEFFKSENWQIPVIFTTAYDEYSLQAFKLNSIDYLLKPIKAVELIAAIEKCAAQLDNKTAALIDYAKLAEALANREARYQTRLLIRYGQTLKAVDIDSVAYFFVDSRVVSLQSFDGKMLPIDQNLDELEQLLNPKQFFRINRKVIVNVRAIKSMHAYSRSRVHLSLEPATTIDTLVSTERSPIFKKWLEGI